MAEGAGAGRCRRGCRRLQDGWPEDLSKTAQNDTYANFGCSQQNNIAAMVANPQDLVRPRATTPADPMRRIKVFENYRNGEAVASAEEQKGDVKISDAVQ
jgi:pilus assembly protein CpaD